MNDKLTRRNLYDLVWSKPMIEVAKEYGLSDRGLAKLCERNSIPVPPRGHWAKKQAGQKVIKPRLLSLEEKIPETIVLFKRAIPVKRSEVNVEDSKEKMLPDDIQDAIEREKLIENLIKVPATLQNPHSIVAGWIKKKEEEERDRRNGLAPHCNSLNLSLEICHFPSTFNWTSNPNGACMCHHGGEKCTQILRNHH